MLGEMCRRAWLCFFCLWAGVFPVGTGRAEAGGREGPLRYRVRIRGVEDPSLLRDLEGVSVLKSLADRPPDTEIQLRRRARRDPPELKRVLRAHGYYAATVRTEYDMDRRRPRVVHHIDLGERYTIRHVQVIAPPDIPVPSGSDLGLAPGEPASARRVLAAEESLRRHYSRRGHPFPTVARKDVWVVHAATAMDVEMEIDPGPELPFGRTGFSGVESVRESFLRGKIPWEEGDLFDRDALRVLRRRFAEADLFGGIRVEPAEEPGDDGTLPVEVEVTERPHRSILFGIGYTNDLGWRGRVGWTHRNLRGAGERLALSFELSEVGQEGEILFRRPDFKRVDQTLTLTARQSLEDTRAFRSEKAGALARIDRLLEGGRVISYGAGFTYSLVRARDERQEYGLVYFPVGMEQDRSDDPLDPRRGARLSIGAAPYHDVLEQDLFFVKSRISLTGYQNLSRRPDVDWAGRASAAVLAGEARNRVPADERYYGGGGGTVRGYAFQSVGPLDENNAPLGGRSLLLLSQELRWRMTETLGLVLFVDGGAVTEELWFDNAVDEIQWGGGLGFRYFTPVGPLRFDVAVPINRRGGVDDPWQFYISLGQAF